MPKADRPDGGALAQELLRTLPDDPMHVEVRGLLMCRPDVQLLPDPKAPTTGGLLFAPLHGLAIGYGTPPFTLARALRQAANRAGMASEDVELHLPLPGVEAWLRGPEVRSLGENRVQALTGPSAKDPILELAGDSAALVRDPSDRRLATLPAALQREFESLCPWPAVVAVESRGRIASIAYAFVETESYFDVSIDTPHPFRREGHGIRCAAALLRHQQTRRKRPVWIAHETNLASLALSERLGFQDVGRVARALLRCEARAS